LHWLEKLNIVGQLSLVGVGIIAAAIYGCQLHTMNGQLDAMNGSGKQTDQLIGLYQQQLAELKKQATDTHELSTQAKIQADKTQELAATSRDALVQVQRAVMSADDIAMLRNKDNGTINQFSFFVHWKNSGTTPTKNLIIHHSWLPTQTLPKDFSYPDLWNPGEPHVYTQSFASPQKVVETTPIDVGPELIKAVQNHTVRLYFWGWAKYQDVFKGTKPHISEYCVEVNGFRGDPFDTDPTHPVLLVNENCKTHNCHDEECTITH
jgi:hypothetical protein